ncbi:MAG: aminotransferase class V-fold PLP-dependent enzyme [Oscillospiraceae bacterium]|nr:aminotransferase class V-fold PLP-dependent enzyme [Oscillospiraceae bacterium]
MEPIYMDNAATTFPKPEEVARAVQDYMTGVGANVGRGSYRSAYAAEEAVYETRVLLAELFGAPECRNVAFTANVTQSLNAALKGLLREGDHVITSSMEHNAVMRPLRQLERHGVSFTRCPCTERGELRTDRLEECLRPETRAVVMTHASNVCGTVTPLEKVGAFCRAHGLLFIVDCAQTAGVLPIDVQAMNVDVLCFTGHKGLLGPQGIGGLVLREGLAARMEPLISGGTGSVSHTEQVPDFMPDRLEAGTLNLPGIMGLRAGLLWLRRTGLARVYAHEQELTQAFLEGLEGLTAEGVLVPVGLPGVQGRTGVVSLRMLRGDPAEWACRLDEKYGIMTRVGLHCAPAAHRTLGTFPEGTVRFSFGWWNTPEQVAAAVGALEEIGHGI